MKYSAILAYHEYKSTDADLMVNVWGADHAGHVPRIRAGLAALGVKTPLDVVLVQMVKLLRNGEEVKMSKRNGEIYLLDDLIDEIGPDAARFLFLSRSPDAQFEFDLSAFAGDDNPVYYLQYGYARIQHIFKRAKEVGVAEFDVSSLHLLKEKCELEIIRTILKLPDEIIAAAAKYEPHRLLYFAQGLIAQFHSYYNNSKVLGDDVALTQAKLALLQAISIAIKNICAILGISTPDTLKKGETI